jgi:hypothetical protein
MMHAPARLEIEGDETASAAAHNVRLASIDPAFFGTVMSPLLAGRAFTPADLQRGRNVAIVNRTFTDRVFRGRNPIGRRVRQAAPEGERPAPWIEIVGVSRDLGMAGDGDGGAYLPLRPDITTGYLAVHVRGEPEQFAPRLRALVTTTDPTLRLYDVMRLDQVGADQWLESQFLSWVLALLGGVALLLSLMAIYAVMSFTVAQRTREIGTRVALGAARWQVVVAVVRRPLTQIGLGIGAGTGLVILLFTAMFDSAPTATEAGLLAGYAGLMLSVCLSACAVPTRRAL